jgi:hypothetical protein
MVHGWTKDACEKQNHDLLKEIGSLLLYAPATIQRLKENDLPKLMKNLSKDSDNEGTGDLGWSATRNLYMRLNNRLF